MSEYLSIASEFVFVLCGLVSVATAFRALKNEQARIGTFLFWLILGLIFILGNLLPSELVGALLLAMGVLSATKQVRMGKFSEADPQFKKMSSEKVGNMIFIPAVMIGVVAMVLSMINIPWQGESFAIPSAVAIGAASIAALVTGMLILRPKNKETIEDSTRLLMQVGGSSLLPQLLAALGAVFTSAGVGTVIANAIGGIIPEGNVLIGVIIYVVGMVVFTMIMGNGFAAFSVITVGIGIPFVIQQGGDPAMIGALGLTAGFCGTLMTPMAANFNIVPSAVLETKNKYAVIKAQVPMALAMIVVHVILMLVLGF